MAKTFLKNGINVLLEKRDSNSAVIALQVNVGANNEDDSNRGVSHFIEHMLFEGTKKRTSHEIGNAIESIGGELNAFTSHDRTVYYAVVPKNHFETGLDVISDILLNPLFSQKSLEKERKVIIDEINLTQDDPKFYQYIFFLSNLFKKHPIRHPLYGYKDTISRMNRSQLVSYYNKYYVASNMSLVIIGNFDEDARLLENYFGGLKQGKLQKKLFLGEPASNKQETFIETKDMLQSYIALGYKIPFRRDKDSYVVDVIRAILSRGQSSRLFNELRTKRGLCYVVGGIAESGLDYGYFIIYVGTDKKNIEKVINIIKKELNYLQDIPEKEISDAKTYIEGSFMIENEDPKKRADALMFWNCIDENLKIDDYLKNIRKVTKQDVSRVAKKYLTDNYLLTTFRQK